MYALGMMTAEVLTGEDMFHQLKNDFTLRGFVASKVDMVDPIKAIMEQAAEKYNLNQKMVELCMQCVNANSFDRMQIGIWNEAWRNALQLEC